MIIRNLHADNYRNIGRLSLEFSGTFNFITGMNAQGKTNLLEAIHLFSLGRSFRTRRADELVKFGEEYFFLRLGGRSDNGVDFTLEYGHERGGSVRSSINGKKLRGLSEMIGVIPSVIFTPEDVEITSGPPSGRRLFLDYTAAQVSPPLLADLKEYRRVLRHRNSLLRSAAYGGGNAGGIESWTDMLVEKGCAIVRGRKEVLAGLSQTASEIYSEIRPGGESLGLSYDCSFCSGDEDLRESFLESLDRSREAERKRGYTAAGPHFDDITVFLDDLQVRKYGSQGRKRLVAIVLKLAQAETIMSRRGERPVVLLDDIFSELDLETAEKVRRLLSDRYQSFITSPRRGVFPEGAGESRVFFVADGRFAVENEGEKGL